MKWQEVRGLFPDQFVLVSIIHYHEEDNKMKLHQFVLYQKKMRIKNFFE